MTLQTSGAISLDDVNVELDKSSGSLISLNDSDVRELAEVASGTISLSDLYGKALGLNSTLSTELMDNPLYIGFTVDPALGNPKGSIDLAAVPLIIDNQDNIGVFRITTMYYDSQSTSFILRLTGDNTDFVLNKSDFDSLTINGTTFNSADASTQATTAYYQWVWFAGVPSFSINTNYPFTIKGTPTPIYRGIITSDGTQGYDDSLNSGSISNDALTIDGNPYTVEGVRNVSGQLRLSIQGTNAVANLSSTSLSKLVVGNKTYLTNTATFGTFGSNQVHWTWNVSGATVPNFSAGNDIGVIVDK